MGRAAAAIHFCSANVELIMSLAGGACSAAQGRATCVAAPDIEAVSTCNGLAEETDRATRKETCAETIKKGTPGRALVYRAPLQPHIATKAPVHIAAHTSVVATITETNGIIHSLK